MKPRIIIATPLDGTPETGTVHAKYAEQRELLRMARGYVTGVVPPVLMTSCDVVRARNRAVYHILDHATECTHVLWWDSDNAPDDAPALVDEMLSKGHDLIAAPYPSKSMPPRIVIAKHQATMGHAENGCIRVAGFGFGFVLMHVSLLVAMTQWFQAEDWYIDVLSSGAFRKAVGLFDLVHSYDEPQGWDSAVNGRWRERLSEDMSFCYRARAMGVQPWLYVGPGAPIAHIGQHVFRTTMEAHK